ncbi:MAG: ABC transporter substrate-binding protein [Bacteroidota bacterium]|nr:ABC transporter substrate-binding protein [Bacteroidota bacterium]
MEGYSQLSVIDPWQGASGVVQTWYLVPEGIQAPAGIDQSYVIHVPVRRIVCMSTTHLSMISAIGESRSIAGFSGTRLIFDRDLSEKAAEGIIREVGYDDNLNKELIMNLNPDIVIVYGIGSESAGYIGKLRELGVPVFFDADYLEDNPLGKAEWLKAIGELFCKKQKADSIFGRVESRYNKLRDYIKAGIKERPKVLLGLPFKDTWYISPGNSYISNLIRDAGGDYLWEETESRYSMPLSPESVYIKALAAGYWLNTGVAESLKDILAIDTRLAELPPFRDKMVFNNTLRINKDGGNDYWEGGTVNPDVILADIASILHPDLFQGRNLVYYKKLN